MLSLTPPRHTSTLPTPAIYSMQITVAGRLIEIRILPRCDPDACSPYELRSTLGDVDYRFSKGLGGFLR